MYHAYEGKFTPVTLDTLYRTCNEVLWEPTSLSEVLWESTSVARQPLYTRRGGATHGMRWNNDMRDVPEQQQLVLGSYLCRLGEEF